MKKLTVLGATGSIGKSTLDVVARHPEQFAVFALAAGRNVDVMLDLVAKFKPEYVVFACREAQLDFRARSDFPEQKVLLGEEGACLVAGHENVDVVMSAIVGAAGLLPTLKAIEAGKRVLLANKESLVMAGKLMMAAVKKSKAVLLPIDSEHNAIFQCLPESFSNKLENHGVSKIILTASGGPFRDSPELDFSTVTPEQACAHPNWSMGKKISVDSATLMNKGLEFIEACHLFDLSPQQLEVVIHPQSIIHSMVQYNDGSVLAQMGNPDMRTPIAHALAWPRRIESGVAALDLVSCGALDFRQPDPERFPALALAMQAAESGKTAPAVLNAANEVAVEAFLQRQIRFDAIPALVADVLDCATLIEPESLGMVIQADQQARMEAHKLIKEKYSNS